MSFHTNAIDLNGTNENLLNSTSQAIGISTSWTISLWFKTGGAPSGNATVFEIRPPSGAVQNAIRFYSGAGSWGGSSINIYDSAGGNMKAVTINLANNTLYNVVITWNGTVLSAKVNNGTAVTNSSAMTMSNGNRCVVIGSNVNSFGGPSAIIASRIDVWDAVISNNSITALYASGNGYDIDVRNSYGDYTETSNLKHQWLCGKDSSLAQSDYVSSGNINIYANMSNITSDDIVTFGDGIPSANTSNFFLYN